MDTFGMCLLQNPNTTKLSGLYVLYLQRAYVYICRKAHVMFTWQWAWGRTYMFVSACSAVQTSISMGRVVRPTRFKPTSMIGLVIPVWMALVCSWWNPNSLTLFNLYVPYFSWHFVFPTHHGSVALPCKFDRLSQILSFHLRIWVYCMKEKRQRASWID